MNGIKINEWASLTHVSKSSSTFRNPGDVEIRINIGLGL